MREPQAPRVLPSQPWPLEPPSWLGPQLLQRYPKGLIPRSDSSRLWHRIRQDLNRWAQTRFRKALMPDQTPKAVAVGGGVAGDAIEAKVALTPQRPTIPSSSPRLQPIRPTGQRQWVRPSRRHLKPQRARASHQLTCREPPQKLQLRRLRR